MKKQFELDKLDKIDPDKLEAVLPQTQCQLCDHPGCKPYAQAIANDGERIDKCHPGGVETLIQLGQLTQRPVSADMLAAMAEKFKPPVKAIIRERDCIGCTKCITACPVDAIVGTGKAMHTIIPDLCTGCELCLPPCPTDCIDLLDSPPMTDEQAQASKARFEKRNHRLSRQAGQQNAFNQRNKETKSNAVDYEATILAAVAREKSRRQQGQNDDTPKS